MKRSIDIYVLIFNQARAEKILEAACNIFLIVLKVLMHFIKFNEDPILYEELNINGFLEKLNFQPNASQTQDLASFQADLYNLGEFSFNFTTPYDYLGLF